MTQRGSRHRRLLRDRRPRHRRGPRLHGRRRTPGSRSTIINQSMARRFFPAGGAIGKRWTSEDGVAGLAGDRRRGARTRSTWTCAARRRTWPIALSASRRPPRSSAISKSARQAPSLLAPTVRQALAEVEPALPVFDIVPLDQRLTRGLTNDRLIANLTSAFGIVALLLACLGLYGTISYGVARRIAELGVRMALGADRATVAWLVVREALVLVAVGAASDCRWRLPPGAASCRCCTASSRSIPPRTRRRRAPAPDRRRHRRLPPRASRVAHRPDGGAAL